MKFPKETKWLCENAKSLEKFSGRWVLFSVHEGLVSKGKSLSAILKTARKKKTKLKPFIFHVPSRDELGLPLPTRKKRS